MKLYDWLAKNKKTCAEFARERGLVHETVRKHANGERRPTQKFMREYFQASGGQVTPNDFFYPTGGDHAPPQ